MPLLFLVGVYKPVCKPNHGPCLNLAQVLSGCADGAATVVDLPGVAKRETIADGFHI